jgi:hypothetical protein
MRRAPRLERPSCYRNCYRAPSANPRELLPHCAWVARFRGGETSERFERDIRVADPRIAGAVTDLDLAGPAEVMYSDRSAE